ncbi:MAG TPA: hypothetical protein VNZ49_09955 [Bacteroidia bacterium]|jgi:hypothetical protein|nr:hypothetical protein [Bacteroidia bacterium]
MKKLIAILFFLPYLLISQNSITVAIKGYAGVKQISKGNLAGVQTLEAVNDNGAPVDYKIISYELLVKIKGQPVLFKGSGGSLSNLSILGKNISVGSKIFFDNIKIKGPDGKIVTAKPAWYLIKE